MTRLVISEKARNTGFHITGTRGGGKSTLEAIIALTDFVRGYPVIIFDAQGGLIEQLLWRIRKLNFGRELRNQLIDRIIYADMSGKSGRVLGWPLLYQLPGDSLWDASQRPLQLIRKIDPALRQAPIMGAAALNRIGTHAGMGLLAMGYQLTEALDLLDSPGSWTQRLRQAAQENPEARRATGFFLNTYPNMNEHDQYNLTLTFRNKIEPFALKPALTEMFGAKAPSIDWSDVIQNSKMVILDFRGISSDFEIHFKTRWCFDNLLEYLRNRRDGRSHPVTVIIDEFGYLLSMRTSEEDTLINDIQKFLNTYMRKQNIRMIFAHPDLSQLPKQAQSMLLSLGTQILGATADPDIADLLARRYLDYDWRIPKKRIPKFSAVSIPADIRNPEMMRWHPRYGPPPPPPPSAMNHYEIVLTSVETEEFTLEEQREMLAKRFMDLGLFEFWVSHSGVEGVISRKLHRVSIGLQAAMVGFPKEGVVEMDRQLLIERSAPKALPEPQRRRTRRTG